MRQAKALCIVLALLFAAPAVDMVVGVAEARDPAPQGFAGVEAASLSDVKTTDELISRIDALAFSGGELPQWFDEEVGLPPGARDVRVSGSVVGYVVDIGAAQTLRDLKGHMAARGWSCVAMGDYEGIACVKDSGACTWALVTCTQVGEATSVVVRCNAT